MGKLVILTRPDGTTFQADEESAAHLVALGYKPETDEAKTERAYRAGQEEYYSSTGQKIKTGLEGLESGLTLGVSDKLLQWSTDAGVTGDEWRHRAEVNPGTRMASQVVGAIAPSLLTGGESLLQAPSGLLTSGAGALTRGIEGYAARGAARGAIEGAGFGLGGEISSTALTGDPLTVEGAIAGMGWGAVWGGALGGVGGAIEGRVAKRAAFAATEALEKGKPAFSLPEEQWQPLHASIKDAAAKAEGTFKQASADVEGMLGQAKAAVAEAQGIRQGVFNEPWTEQIGVGAKKEAISAFNDMKAALKEKDWVGLETATANFNEHLGALNEHASEFSHAVGGTSTQTPLIFKFAASTASDTLEQVKDLGAIGATLKSFAETPAGFASMGPGKFEKMHAALEKFMDAPSAELAGAQNGLALSIKGMAEHVGVTSKGNPAAQLKAVWETLREMKSAAGTKAAGELASKGGESFIKELVGAGVAKATKGGYMGYLMGKSIASGLLNLKGAILKGISDGAATWSPRVGKALKYTGPQIKPLLTRLDGTEDLKNRNKSDQELLMERAKEIREAAPSVRDTLYKGVAHFDLSHPEFAQEAHKAATEQFMWIYNKLPQDPGNAFSNMQSLWKADPLQTAKFSRYYEVFQNPAGVMMRALSGSRITPEAAEGLQNMSPALFTYLRTAMLERVSDPAVMKKMSYQDQIQVGLLTGLTLHSTMTPQFIASQQQMYQERSQKLPMNSQPGAEGNSGGRPDTQSPFASSANKITAHS